MVQKYSNFATTNLAQSITDTDNTIEVTPSEGGKFDPLLKNTDFEVVVLTDGSNYEIVKVEDRVNDTFTVTRAQEGTLARNWDATTTSFLGLVTKESLSRFVQFDEINPAFALTAYRLFR